MSDSSGDKTEKPTPKRLRDARRKGDVAKSQDLLRTLSLGAWLVVLLVLVPGGVALLSRLFDWVFDAIAHSGETPVNVAAATGIGVLALAKLLLPLLGLGAVLGCVAEWLQVGSLFAPKRVAPEMGRVNPAEGFKKLFSAQNLVEVLKSVFKCALLLVVLVVLLRAGSADFVKLMWADARQASSLLGHWLVLLVAVTLVPLGLVAAVDVMAQRHFYLSRLKMSLRDVRQEARDNEGDPHLKQRRKEMQQEWQNQSRFDAVRGAKVLIVNPIHLAIALHFDAEAGDLPRVAAKGDGESAREMREIAAAAGVPVVEQVGLARELFANIDTGDYITGEYFEAVAQVLRWAADVAAEERAPGWQPSRPVK